MGLHEQTVKVLEDQDLVKKIYGYAKMFGITATGKKYQITAYLVREVLNKYGANMK